MFKKVTKWLKNENSVSVTTEGGMMMLGGIVLAVGVTYLVSQYMKSSGNTTLAHMDTTAASGIDPDLAPTAASGSGWVKP